MLFLVKMRLFLLLWGMSMLLLSVSATYAGVSSVLEYLSFPPVVIYAAGMIALLFSFFIILPLSLAAFYSSVKGGRLPERKARLLFRIFVGCVIASVLFAFLFKFFYVSELKEREYVACKGIPSGWMPAMATKYAINEALCHEER